MATPRIIITLLAAAGLVMLDMAGALKGSVGGSMTILLVLLLAALVAGLYDAWTMKRGPLGWLGSILVAFLGTIVGALATGALMDMIIPLLRLQGAPGRLLLALTAIITLTCTWTALALVGRLQRRSRGPEV